MKVRRRYFLTCWKNYSSVLSTLSTERHHQQSNWLILFDNILWILSKKSVFLPLPWAYFFLSLYYAISIFSLATRSIYFPVCFFLSFEPTSFCFSVRLSNFINLFGCNFNIVFFCFLALFIFNLTSIFKFYLFNLLIFFL